MVLGGWAKPGILRDIDRDPYYGIGNDLAEKGYAEKTIMEIKQAAVQVLDAAVENDYLHRNVFTKEKVPKMGRTERRPIREQEKTLILEHHAGHRMGVPALLLLYTGLRKYIGEDTSPAGVTRGSRLDARRNILR